MKNNFKIYCHIINATENHGGLKATENNISVVLIHKTLRPSVGNFYKSKSEN